MSTSNDPLDEAAQDSLIPAIPRGKISSDIFADARKKSEESRSASAASAVSTTVGRLVGVPLSAAHQGDFPLQCASCGSPLTVSAVGGPYLGITKATGPHPGCSECLVEKVIDAKNVLSGTRYYEIPEGVSLVPDPNATSPLALVLDHQTLEEYTKGAIPADVVHRILEDYLKAFSNALRGTPASDLIPLLTLFIQGGHLVKGGPDEDEDDDDGEEWKKGTPPTDTCSGDEDDPYFFKE